MSQAIRKEIDDFTRGLLDQRLAKLLPKQVAYFWKLNPNGVKSEDLVSRIDLCDRTLHQNEKFGRTEDDSPKHPASPSGTEQSDTSPDGSQEGTGGLETKPA